MNSLPETSVLQLSAQILQSKKRLLTLENDVTEAQLLVKESSTHQNNTVDKLKTEFMTLNIQLQSAKKLLDETTKSAGKLMLQLRGLVKHVSIDELNDQIDKIPFEQLITRKEFDQLLQEKLYY